MTATTTSTRRFRAETDGKCDCCMTPYRKGARLHIEFDKYRVLDVHPEPKIAPVKRKWRTDQW